MSTSTNTETTTKKNKAPKAAKPSKKGAAKKAKGAEVDRDESITSKYAGKKIKLLVKENPKREGTKAYKTFGVYKNGMTVEDALEAGKKVGLRTSTLRWDLKHKYITIH